MASNGEMFQFISNFGPMLGELAAHVEYLEARVSALEEGGGARPGAAPAGDDVPGDEESIEFMGQTFSMKDMLGQAAASGGGVAGLMDKIKNWKKPGQQQADAPTPPASEPTKPT